MAKNKTMRKVSKKTIGSKVDTVADYVDILSQMVTEYLNQRYKIEQKVENIKYMTLKTLYDFKKQVISSVVEIIFLSTGVLALIIGIVMILSKVLPLELIFIFYGLIVTLGVMFTMKTHVK